MNEELAQCISILRDEDAPEELVRVEKKKLDGIDWDSLREVLDLGCECPILGNRIAWVAMDTFNGLVGREQVEPTGWATFFAEKIRARVGEPARIASLAFMPYRSLDDDEWCSLMDVFGPLIDELNDPEDRYGREVRRLLVRELFSGFIPRPGYVDWRDISRLELVGAGLRGVKGDEGPIEGRIGRIKYLGWGDYDPHVGLPIEGFHVSYDSLVVLDGEARVPFFEYLVSVGEVMYCHRCGARFPSDGQCLFSRW